MTGHQRAPFRCSLPWEGPGGFVTCKLAVWNEARMAISKAEVGTTRRTPEQSSSFAPHLLGGHTSKAGGDTIQAHTDG
jgi:hypothetical protein